MILKVEEVTDAQNKVMMQGSTKADVDELFALYSSDFVYEHEAYGGAYSRETLYKNTLRVLDAGRYDMSSARYTITSTIAGDDAIAVERKEHTGATHLAVFEFKNGKVSRIVEYWK